MSGIQTKTESLHHSKSIYLSLKKSQRTYSIIPSNVTDNLVFYLNYPVKLIFIYLFCLSIPTWHGQWPPGIYIFPISTLLHNMSKFTFIEGEVLSF